MIQLHSRGRAPLPLHHETIQIEITIRFLCERNREFIILINKTLLFESTSEVDLPKRKFTEWGDYKSNKEKYPEHYKKRFLSMLLHFD